ncbi:hypothetical protein RIF29_09830 [Crotalaria pallida]|uniref:Uncharacterized protein n=1 Tax=Crotalaria pallida TaxID=3830 RepID=A0AAN9FSA6_CROPI
MGATRFRILDFDGCNGYSKEVGIDEDVVVVVIGGREVEEGRGGRQKRGRRAMTIDDGGETVSSLAAEVELFFVNNTDVGF